MSILDGLFGARVLGALGGLGSIAAQQRQQFGHQFESQEQARQRMFSQPGQAQQLRQDQQYQFDRAIDRARQAQPPTQPPPSKSKYDDGDVIDIECEETKQKQLGIE